MSVMVFRFLMLMMERLSGLLCAYTVNTLCLNTIVFMDPSVKLLFMFKCLCARSDRTQAGKAFLFE